jgi:hypothetical protein
MSQLSPLAEQVLAGGNRQLQVLAAQGLLPLVPAELVPLQVALARGSDGEVADIATRSLLAQAPDTLTPFLSEEADADVLRFFATESTHPAVLEAIIRRRNVPRDLLADLAPRLGPELQEVLILRQDAIVEHPEILQRLEQNPQLTQYSVRRILEYREHLLPRARQIAAAIEAIPALADPEVFNAVEEARNAPGSGEKDETLGLNEGQIRSLPVPVRLKLARGAPRLLRSILIKDNSSLVVLAVMESNPLSEQEVEQFAASRAVIDEVLEYISRKNDWVRKYQVRLNLVSNPRLQSGIAIRLMSGLSVRDLRNLSRDRNIPDAVRNQAMRLYRVKST